jgi:predicted nuclease with TOPRIM domain
MIHYIVFSSIALVFILIITIFAFSDLCGKYEENKEFIQYLIVKYNELKTHCDWLEQRVKWHKVELDKLEQEKGSDDETAF